jgi:acyl-CoA reductase-like NAD-dependent aldehyde dehydrogenase
MSSRLELINPANGEKFRELPYHNWDEAKSLLVKADNTQKQWRHAEISERESP